MPKTKPTGRVAHALVPPSSVLAASPLVAPAPAPAQSDLAQRSTTRQSSPVATATGTGRQQQRQQHRGTLTMTREASGQRVCRSRRLGSTGSTEQPADWPATRLSPKFNAR